MKLKKYPPGAILAALLTIVLGNLCANALNGDVLYEGWLPHAEEYQIWISLLTILIFISSFIYLFKHRKDFQVVRVLYQNEKTEPHRAMILLLSSPGKPDKVNFDNSNMTIAITTQNGSIEVPSANNSDSPLTHINKDIDRLKGTKWSWQQMLRAVSYHIKSIEYIYIIGSKDTLDEKGERVDEDMPGSFRFCNNAVSLIRRYKPDLTEENIKVYGVAIDFEDLNQVVAAIRSGMYWAKKEKNVTDNDIIIEITGGQRPAAIAGAMTTLDNGITFQYVQTGGDNKVRSYDLDIYSPPPA